MISRIDKAFGAIKRADFLPDESKARADIDAPISIGFGQTNSQPSTVQMMLEWLDPGRGEKVLDVGSGSGWTSALLAYLVGSSGRVYAVEKVPELVKFGTANCRRAGIRNIQFFGAVSAIGLPDFAPYNRILVSAVANELPPELPAQLVAGGRLVIPIKNSVYVIDKNSDGSLESTEYPGFIFVPLI